MLHLRQIWVGLLIYTILLFSLHFSERSPDMTEIFLTGTLSLNSIQKLGKKIFTMNLLFKTFV